MAIASQQHAEVIKPGYHALQFHPVYQEDGQWGFALTNMVEESIL
jgi:hypothetical protein